jgi:hypothetical protein
MSVGILTEDINAILLGDDLCEKQLADAGVPSEEEIFDHTINGTPIKYKIVPNKKRKAEIESMIPSIEEMRKQFVGSE